MENGRVRSLARNTGMTMPMRQGKETLNPLMIQRGQGSQSSKVSIYGMPIYGKILNWAMEKASI